MPLVKQPPRHRQQALNMPAIGAKLPTEQDARHDRLNTALNGVALDGHESGDQRLGTGIKAGLLG